MSEILTKVVDTCGCVPWYVPYATGEKTNSSTDPLTTCSITGGLCFSQELKGSMGVWRPKFQGCESPCRSVRCSFLVLLKTAVPEFCPCPLLSQLTGIIFFSTNGDRTGTAVLSSANSSTGVRDHSEVYVDFF